MTTSTESTAFLSAPPAGFSAAVDCLNACDSDLLAQITKEACASAFEQRSPVALVILQNAFESTLNKQQITSICYALAFVYRGALKREISKLNLGEGLMTHCDFDTHVLKVIVLTYSRRLKQAKAKQQNKIIKERKENDDDIGMQPMTGLESAKSILNLGRLVSMAWVVGMTVRSNTMARINKPFVRLSLKISHGSTGQIKTHYVTLSMLQFQQFRNEIKTTRNLMSDIDY